MGHKQEEDGRMTREEVTGTEPQMMGAINCDLGPREKQGWEKAVSGPTVWIVESLAQFQFWAFTPAQIKIPSSRVHVHVAR